MWWLVGSIRPSGVSRSSSGAASYRDNEELRDKTGRGGLAKRTSVSGGAQRIYGRHSFTDRHRHRHSHRHRHRLRESVRASMRWVNKIGQLVTHW